MMRAVHCQPHSKAASAAQRLHQGLVLPPARARLPSYVKPFSTTSTLLSQRSQLLGRCYAIEPAQPAGAGATATSPKKLNTVRVRYVRRDKRYQGWGLHTWGDVTEPTDWQRALQPVGLDKDGVYWEVALRPEARFLGLLVHQGETKSARAELMLVDVGPSGEVLLAGDEQHAFLQGAVPDLSNLPVGTLNKQAAIWVSEDIIAWRHDLHDVEGPRRFHLYANSKGHMWINGAGVQGPEHCWELQPVSSKLPPDLAAKWPYLAGCAALKIPDEALEQVMTLFRSQLAVSCTAAGGSVMEATGVQMQGGLDAHCTYTGPLGVFNHPDTQELMVAVWAPSAQSVELLHYQQARGGDANVLHMHHGVMGPGVWSAVLPKEALFTYYKYRVHVYSPLTARMEVSEATDPYSRSLAADGDRSQVVLPDLRDPSMVPKDWDSHKIPSIERWTDISVYELHIRDFSSEDTSVKESLRGKYLAFVPDKAGVDQGQLTHGLKHLQGLRKAGLNHLHLLPTYDFGSVPERPEEQKSVQDDLSQYPADSEAQQAAVLAVADQDAFNWGYDPVHYGVPEGSYATNPDGQTRVHEFRQMVTALHKQGWRVVLDVVYNHVFAAGPTSRYSVLDKIVPGYYQRRFEDGEMCHSTCCNNTATEHAMCERLVVDDIVHWAKNYKIDGFRFDIMGHLMLTTLQKMRQGLDALTPEKDGVDGKRIYIYGEAWDFGEVFNNARGINCGQMNLAGTRLGAFNDRLRDGALGGGPFEPYDFQGLVTGLGLAPNSCRDQGDHSAQMKELAILTDWVKYSLAGNLRQYTLETASGAVLSGGDAKAHGLPLAYGGHPCEHVAFIGCHDNHTMFDFVTEKASLLVTAEERMRMQVMCLSFIIFAQGIPFIHAGDDLLRSKSLDRDSYNSGDWFNGVDWTGATHKLGIGLPVQTKNGGAWHYKRALLTNPMIKPTPALIRTCRDITQQLLTIRYSSPLFRLPSTQAVCKQVKFHNNGPSQVPGVVVMQLSSAAAPGPDALTQHAVDGTDVLEVHDPTYQHILVVFNASPLAQDLPYPDAGLTRLVLHPIQAAAGAPDTRAGASVADNSARLLHVEARSTAVFVQKWK